MGFADGHDLKIPQTPLQTDFGAGQMHSVGFLAGDGVNPSLQLKPHGFLPIHAGVACSGYVQCDFGAF